MCIRDRALELIGKLYDVGAFMERKETTVIHQKSGDIKAQLLERIKQVIDVEAKPKRSGGASLLEEIESGKAQSVDPTVPPPPNDASERVGDPTHTIPLTQPSPKSVDLPETPPSPSKTQ